MLGSSITTFEDPSRSSLEYAPRQWDVTELSERRTRNVLQRAEEDMVDGAGHKIRNNLQKSADANDGGAVGLAPDWRHIEAIATR